MNAPYTVGIIRVISQSQEQTDVHGVLLERWFPAFATISRCIPDQPEGIHDASTKAAALPKIAALAEQMAREGIDGLLISCADDPGVSEAKGRLGVPVVGAGESTASTAVRLGERIGVLGITQQVPESYERILGDRLIGNVVPDGVTSTLDLRTSAGRKSTVEAARLLHSQGADVIALACTGLATTGIAPLLERETGIPVLDPVLCAGSALALDILRCRTLN